MDDLYTEASLSDSFIYQSFNGNAEMTQIIISAIKNSLIIDSSYIEEQIMQIQRTRISPLSDEVLSAFEHGEIVLLYSKIIKIPQALPFFATKMQGKVKVFVFVNHYGTIAKSDVDSSKKYLNITMKDLYVLMEGAYTAYKYAVYPAKLTKNLGLMKISCDIYTNMILRILNKNYALSMDPQSYANASFCISRFFLERIWMSENRDINFNYAKNIINTKVGINVAELVQLSEIYDSSNIQNISNLITFLKTQIPRLKSISFRYFVQSYMDMYKPGATFGLECLPYFMYVVEATMIGSFALINQALISDITKNTKGMNTFYPELVKSIQ